MGSIDIETLLGDISAEAPSGEDLSYDASYLELERAVQGTMEQQVGDSVIEAVEPDWPDIRNRSTELLGKSRDLRIIVYLTLSLMKTNGLSGLTEGLKLLSGALARHWDTVFPQLDPSDNNDPMERMNIISSIATRDAFQDPISFLKRLREVHILRAPQLGSFSLNDIMMARGELPVPEGTENPPKEAFITGALTSGNPDEIAATTTNAVEALTAVEEIGRISTEKVGSRQAPDLSALEEVLRRIAGVFTPQGQAGPEGAAAGAEAGAAQSMADAALPGAIQPAGAGGQRPAGVAGFAGAGLSGEVQTRDDVTRAIDQICRYYERFEPSSPIPLLLKRAKRLVSKDFLEIIKDLTPEALAQVEHLGGLKVQAEGEQPPASA